MGRFLYVMIFFIMSSVAFAGEPKLYTDEDLLNYGGNNGSRSSSDEYLKRLKEESAKRSADIDARIGKLNREIKDMRDRSDAQRRDIDSYSPSSASTTEVSRFLYLTKDHFRRTLKDPDSLKIYNFQGVKQGPYFVVSVDYGARNSFGGYIRESSVLTFKGDELVRVD